MLMGYSSDDWAALAYDSVADATVGRCFKGHQVFNTGAGQTAPCRLGCLRSLATHKAQQLLPCPELAAYDLMPQTRLEGIDAMVNAELHAAVPS